MKKNIKRLLLITCAIQLLLVHIALTENDIFSIGNIKANAAFGVTEDWRYDVTTDSGLILNSYIGDDTVVVIPSQIEGLVVTDISAYANLGEISSVSIPSSITRIGSYGIFNRDTLTKITVDSGNSVYDSRDNCNALIEKSGNALVVGCKETKIPSTVRYIGEDAFLNCTGLKSIVIPPSVKGIGESAFYGCTGLRWIEIPSSVTYIGESAFSEIPGLIVYCEENSYASEYADENGLNYRIGKCDESGEWGYVLLDDNTVEVVGYHGTSLEVVIPALIDGYSVSSIGWDLIYDFENVTDVHIPASVTNIDEDAFNFCNGITIHCNPESYAHEYAVDHSILWQTNGNLDATGEWGYELLDDDTVKVTVYCGDASLVVIPEIIDGHTVSGIGKYAFYSREDIRFIEIPSSVTSIGESAFLYMWDFIVYVEENSYASEYADENGLNYRIGKFDESGEWGYVLLDDNTVEVVWYHGASSEVVIPALIDGYSVSSINEDILYDFENISSIHIPSSVTSIGDDIFYFCDGIVIHCNPDSYARKYAADNNILWKTNGNRDATGEWEYELLDDNTVKITVYYGNTSKLVIPEKIDGYTVSGIGKYAFYTCQQTGFIEIPESIKCIEEDAFAGGSLTSFYCVKDSIAYEYIMNRKNNIVGNCNITVKMGEWEYGVQRDETFSVVHYYGDASIVVIPKEIDEYPVTYIGDFAFKDCINLRSIEIPSGITGISPNFIFEGCTNLEKIVVNVSNEVYDSRDNCSAIIHTSSNSLMVGCKNTIIPSSVTCIEEGAFHRCAGLESVIIPAGVTDIYAGAFAYCVNLKNIQFTSGLKGIGWSAFFGCDKLESVEIPESVTSIAPYAFAACSNLESIVIPSKETDVLFGAFESCDKLTIYSLYDSKVHTYAIDNDLKWQDIRCMLGCDINECNVALGKVTYTYDGKAKKPSVTVTCRDTILVKDKDYEVTYKSNVKAGKATVTVSGKGIFKGSMTKSFTILPSSVSGFTYGSRTATSITLKWTKNISASGYVIQQYKSGKWTTIKTISSNATVSHKVAGLSSSSNYNFRIRPFKLVGSEKLYGTYSTKKIMTTPSSVKSFTYSSRTATTINLKWKKNTGASGYVIQQYKGGKWTTIKTISKNSTVTYKVSNLKPSSNYNFRIKAYKLDGGKKVYGQYVTKKVKTTPSTVKKFTYKSRTKTTITLKWAKNTSADGYVIQQYKKGKWTTIKTVAKNSTISYRVTGLKKATQYNFRIRAYKKDGNKKVYSTSYTVKKVKTL